MKKVKTIKLKSGQAKNIELIGTSGQFMICAEASSLFASQRTDMGAPFKLTIPEGFRQRVARMWLMYDYDSAFKYLVDRLMHYGANGMTIFTEKPNELKFWDEWKIRLNEGIPTIIPGLEEVVKWNMKHMALGGASFNNWQWGEMTIGKRTYEVPVKWTLHNQQSIIITRQGSGFSEYKAGFYVTKNSLTEGDTNWAKAYNIEKIRDAGTDKDVAFPKDPSTYFVLRFNSTPADLTRTDKSPQSDEAAFSLYPTPPFLSVLPTLLMRQQLRAMDLNIVDGFINKMVIWKIGTKEFPPVPEKKDKDGKVVREATIATVKNVITKETKGNVLQLFVPFWVDVDIKTPDMTPLVSSEKYMQSWIELMHAFGIFVNPKTGASGEFKLINTQNFEQMVDFFRRQHIENMLENTILAEIARRNNLARPKIAFKPLNTVTNEFLQNLRELAAMGKVSTDTLLTYHGIEKQYELPLILGELNDTDRFNKGQFKGWSELEVFNTNTPVRFKQEVVDGAPGSREEDKTKRTMQSTEPPGRPGKGKIGKKPKNNKANEEE